MSNEKIVRVGLIGTGWMGAHHGHNVIKNPNAQLVAIADNNQDSANAFLAKEGATAQVFGDYQQMLAQDDIDAVVVASPNAMHSEHAIAAADAKKHIYLEKPMAISLDDCRAIAKAIDRSGVKCDMGYHRRLNPLVQYAKQLQAEGKLGNMVMAESDYIHHVPGDWDIWSWLGKKDIAGTPIHAGTGHNIDLLRYFCGEIVEIGCFRDIRMPRKVQMETEDIAVMIMRFEDGTIGRMVCFLGPITPFVFTLRLFGTRGTVDNNKVWLDTIPLFYESGHENDCIELPKAWIPDNVQGGISETWDKCMDTFIDDVRLDRKPFNDHISGFNTAAACFAALQSADDKTMVKPEKL